MLELWNESNGDLSYSVIVLGPVLHHGEPSDKIVQERTDWTLEVGSPNITLYICRERGEKGVPDLGGKISFSWHYIKIRR